MLATRNACILVMKSELIDCTSFYMKAYQSLPNFTGILGAQNDEGFFYDIMAAFVFPIVMYLLLRELLLRLICSRLDDGCVFACSVEKSVRAAPGDRHVQALQRPQEPAHVQQHPGVSAPVSAGYEYIAASSLWFLVLAGRLFARSLPTSRLLRSFQTNQKFLPFFFFCSNWQTACLHGVRYAHVGILRRASLPYLYFFFATCLCAACQRPGHSVIFLFCFCLQMKEENGTV